MDWPTFIGTVIVLLVAVTPMMVFPKARKVITDINSAIPIQLDLCIYLWD